MTAWTVARQAPLSMGMLQARILENMGKRTGYSPWGHKELETTERLSTAHKRGYWVASKILFLDQVVVVRSIQLVKAIYSSLYFSMCM